VRRISLTTEIEIGEQLKDLPTGQIFLVKKGAGQFVIFQRLEKYSTPSKASFRDSVVPAAEFPGLLQCLKPARPIS
jgi:hypothetical protein